jgi:hypothetical protein
MRREHTGLWTFENIAPWRNCGPKKGVTHKLGGLHSLYSSPNIARFMRRRLWGGSGSSTNEETSYAYKISGVNPNRKIPFGRRRFKKNIKVSCR